MEYRLGKEQLLDIMMEWNRFLKRRVHLIACGGTAMTLLGIKPLTEHFDELLMYEVAEARLKPNIDYFLDRLRENGLYD